MIIEDAEQAAEWYRTQCHQVYDVAREIHRIALPAGLGRRDDDQERDALYGALLGLAELVLVMGGEDGLDAQLEIAETAARVIWALQRLPQCQLVIVPITD